MADDICRLIQVREKNQAMIPDWLLFLMQGNFKITPSQLYDAFVKALAGDIRDESGDVIEVYPELGNKTTATVINSYLRLKKNDDRYIKGIEDLKKIAIEEWKLIKARKAGQKDYEEYVKTGNMPEFCTWLFDLLVYSEKIKFIGENAAEETPELFNWYCRRFAEGKAELEKETSKDYGEISEITDADVKNKILIATKKIVLKRFFDKQIEENSTTIF